MEDLGAPEPNLTATLVMGTAQAASLAVVAGVRADIVLERTLAMVSCGLAGQVGVADPTDRT